ncbi:MAG TPA: ADP-glyceromanno-heptose 6-epimerase [Stellaceae bacterium]|nr:ADP-glyceromanno-heptose 6-epimerase [Stellaceae bacterium]
MIVVTGGAGFIGSNLVAALEARGERDLAVADRLGSGEKWRNLAKRELAALVSPERIEDFLDAHAVEINAIFHLGAITSTTESDVDAIVAANVTLSLALWNWCVRHGVRFIYASSAATYGAGESGFADEQSPEALARLRPLNAYGWSKHLFDRRAARLAERKQHPPQWIGLKFFNVYGPNEYHKGAMQSSAAQIYPQAREGRAARLFRADAGGAPRRDFVCVEDCIAVMLWLYDHPEVSGIFNVGSGRARSYEDLAAALYGALGKVPQIEHIDMPAEIRRRYQHFTEAPLAKLRDAGYNAETTALETGIARYVLDFLTQKDPYR